MASIRHYSYEHKTLAASPLHKKSNSSNLGIGTVRPPPEDPPPEGRRCAESWECRAAGSFAYSDHTKSQTQYAKTVQFWTPGPFGSALRNIGHYNDLSLWVSCSQGVSEQKENAPECDSGALAKMKLRNNRYATAAVASRQAAWSTLVLVSQLESCRQVRQPSPDTPDRRVSRCLG